MAELMCNHWVMTKLQSEVRRHTPEGHEMVEEENLASMVYLRAVMKETLVGKRVGYASITTAYTQDTCE